MAFQTDIDKQIKKLNRRLNQISTVGIPLAAAGTLNHMAFESRKTSIKTFKRRRIIRSNWTERGMLFEKTRSGIPIRQMEARSGNIRDYAALLEHGGTIKPDGNILEIPALGSRVSKSKKKRIAKRFKLNQLGKVRRLPKISGSPTRRFVTMLNIARKEKYYGPFMITKQDAGGEQMPVGIFNLSGHGRGRKGGGKITMLRKLQTGAYVQGRSFVAFAGKRIGQKMDKTYIKQARRILAKFGKDI